MRVWKIFLIGFLVSLATGLLMLAVLVISYGIYAEDMHDPQRLMNRNKIGLLLLDREGKPFFSLHQGRPDTYVPLEQIPEPVQQAVIAMEDRTFYTNYGYSVKGMIRALVANLKAGRVVQGGSTITQELVKTSLLDNKQNLFRKIQEVVLAFQLNQIYSKQKILEMYLNSVYFGEGAFGIENAASIYYGVHAQELSVPQAALLVGLLPAPSRYSPLSNDPAVAKTRQKIVLDSMARMGYISRLKAVEIHQTPLSYDPKPTSLNQNAFHFALYVRDELVKKFGEEHVLRSGLTVKTTLKMDWQQQAELSLADQVKRLAKNGASNGAVMVINPINGQILTMVGSVDWHNDQFGKVNMAVIPRQVGSAFKPIIYSAAFESDLLTPASILMDRPTEFERDYKPRNYDGRFRGPVTVRRALANSLNVPAVEVMEQVGVISGLRQAQEFGITSLGSPSNYGLSLVLGAGEVSLTELTNAYAVFAANGMRHPLTSVLEIRDKYDQVVEWPTPGSEQVISPGTAYLISSILSDVKARAEVFGRVLNTDRTAAVKTGTSQDYRNAITIGYTPQLVVGVWIGNNNNQPMDRIAGSLGAAPVWKTLLESFLSGTPEIMFAPPATITEADVCPYVGTSSPLASASAYTEYFLSGTEPYQSCRMNDGEEQPEQLPDQAIVSTYQVELPPASPIYYFPVIDFDE